ncbi:MAG: S9 family peptidase [Acidobacteriota bacterium]
MRKLFLLIAGTAIIGTPVLSPVMGRQPELTLEELFHPERKLSFEGTPVPRLEWLAETHGLVRYGTDNTVVLLNPADSTADRLLCDRKLLRESFGRLPGFTPERAERAASGGSLQVSPDAASILVTWEGSLYLFNVANSTLVRATSGTPHDELAEFSPDGNRLAFVRENDLYLLDTATLAVTRLTHDGGPTLLNGRPDWVYWEEIFRRRRPHAYWWSPDSRRIAFLQSDVSPVPEFPLLDDGAPYPKVKSTPYPKAGMPNPVVRVGVVDVPSGDLRWVDWTQSGSDSLVVGLNWSADGENLYCQIQDRRQSRLELFVVEVASGSRRRVLVESTPGWVEPSSDLLVLPGGTVIWPSERTGFRHLYRLEPGAEPVPITSGEWEVTTVAGYEPRTGRVLFTAARDSILEDHLYRVPAQGGTVERLTGEPGVHEVKVSPDGLGWLDTWSSLEAPPQAALRDADGRLVRLVHEPRPDGLDRLNRGRAEFTSFTARDGFSLRALLVYPPEFDPALRYPVLLHVYGGPQAPIVRNRWPGTNGLWHRLLADHGIVICVVDPRQASGKGAVSAWGGHGRLGPSELRDLEDVVAELGRQPWVDRDRLGIWGASYGGFLTAYAMTHSPHFRLGVAVAPVTDWRWYDSIYTERYLGTPDENPDGYRDSSVVEAAASLRGRLLLVHGTADDNVHPQHTLQLVNTLQRAGVLFDLMLYPGAAHGIKEPRQVYHYRKLLTEFVVREFQLR